MSALRRGVALSSSRFCASLLRHGYRVLAFGQGNSGALGLGDLLDSHDPALVVDLPDDVVSIACGHFHSVAVTGEGEVFTWGRNNEGQQTSTRAAETNSNETAHQQQTRHKHSNERKTNTTNTTNAQNNCSTRY